MHILIHKNMLFNAYYKLILIDINAHTCYTVYRVK